MLTLDDPGRLLPVATLCNTAGFAWWYADAIDSQGSGLVCIWSFGLPFLPGRASAARAGTPIPAGAQPSVNLALYREGRPVAYHLLALAPDDVDAASGRWGPCTFRRADRDGQARVEADVNLPVPGSAAPLLGSFSVTGPPARAWGGLASSDGPHHWTPLIGPARAEGRFTHGDRTILDMAGSGYHDRNGCSLPLDQLGLAHWTWGRAEVDGTMLIFYLSWPTEAGSSPSLLLTRGDADGQLHVEDVQVSLGPTRRGVFGMPWWSSLMLHTADGDVNVHVDPPCDDGPFYLRARIRMTKGGARGDGWTELCRPARIDTPALRPLVRMCVQGGAESLWLPLFAGPRRDRWSRLRAWWWSRLTLGARG